METTLTLRCSLHKGFLMSRYVFMDAERFYYLWQLDFSEYGLRIEITAMKQNEDVFRVVETPKTELLVAYLRDILATQNSAFVSEFFETITFFEFEIESKYSDTFGEEFCSTFLCEQDREFILRDVNAKHLIIDFEKIQKRELEFFSQPELFPLYIPQTDVTLTQDMKFLKDMQEISIEEFWKLYEAYKISLTKEIQQKEKIFSSIEKDLECRYTRALTQIKEEKIHDYEVEAYITIFDGFLNEYEILNIIFTEHSFKDTELYSLAIFGFDVKVGRVMYHLIDTFGIQIVRAKLNFWSELEIRNQKFFNI